MFNLYISFYTEFIDLIFYYIDTKLDDASLGLVGLTSELLISSKSFNFNLDKSKEVNLNPKNDFFSFTQIQRQATKSMINHQSNYISFYSF